MTRDRVAVWLVAGVCALAALMVITHLHSTASALNAQKQRNDRYDPIGHALAAADTLDIDNAWAAAAYELVPSNATYAVVLPSRQAITDGRLSEVEYDGLPPYMRYVLLPRLPVSARKAQYILCYSCGRRFPGVKWIWTGDPTQSKLPGLRIGERSGD